MRSVAREALELSERLRAAKTPDECWSTLLEVLSQFGFVSGGYGAGHTPDDITMFMEYPPGMAEEYFSNELYKDDIFVALGCSNRQSPIIAPNHKIFDAFPGHKKVISLVHDYNMSHCALGFRLFDTRWIVGSICLVPEKMTEHDFRKICDEHIDDIHLMSQLFHNALITKPYFGQAYNLSPRVIDCLYFAAMGLSSKEIAEKLGIMPRTVDHHITEAITLLRAKNRTQAIAKAIILNIISV